MRKNIFRLALIVSLLLHTTLTGVMWLKGRSFLKVPQKVSTVELLSPEELAKRLKMNDQVRGQIVEQDRRVNDETPEDSKYLSKFNQKVVRETKAQDHGKFRNATAQGAKTPEPQKTTSIKKEVEKSVNKSEKPKNLMTDENGIAGLPRLKDLKPEFKMGPSENPAVAQGDGVNATDDHLKDVNTGMQTLLSTREFVYYSYYNRIKDKLRQYWEPKIKEKVERVFRQGRSIASASDRITKTVLVLDAKGILIRVQVIGPSGVTELDDAAVEAFKAAAPFPNPPKGIVDDDGTIKIRWDFILEAAVVAARSTMLS